MIIPATTSCDPPSLSHRTNNCKTWLRTHLAETFFLKHREVDFVSFIMRRLLFLEMGGRSSKEDGSLRQVAYGPRLPSSSSSWSGATLQILRWWRAEWKHSDEQTW